MCLDPEATFDALEAELPIEQSCCKVKHGGTVHLRAQFHTCGYQRQKPLAQVADVIVWAHDSLFEMKPEAIGTVGLLVIDEAFWQSGFARAQWQGYAHPGRAGARPDLPGLLQCEGKDRFRRHRRPSRCPKSALQSACSHGARPAARWSS